MITFRVTNLDVLPYGALSEFARDPSNDQRLRDYANLTLIAYRARLDGLTNAALDYEERADRIYNELPDELRW